MSWVLDASATLSWILVRRDAEEARRAESWLDRISHEDGLVPGLWHFDVANASAVAERRGAISAEAIFDFLLRLEALPIQTVHGSGFRMWEALLVRARSHGLTAYDAAYLDLAQQRGAALATFDRRLAAAAEAAGVTLA